MYYGSAEVALAPAPPRRAVDTCVCCVAIPTMLLGCGVGFVVAGLARTTSHRFLQSTSKLHQPRGILRARAHRILAHVGVWGASTTSSTCDPTPARLSMRVSEAPSFHLPQTMAQGAPKRTMALLVLSSFGILFLWKWIWKCGALKPKVHAPGVLPSDMAMAATTGRTSGNRRGMALHQAAIAPPPVARIGTLKDDCGYSLSTDFRDLIGPLVIFLGCSPAGGMPWGCPCRILSGVARCFALAHQTALLLPGPERPKRPQSRSHRSHKRRSTGHHWSYTVPNEPFWTPAPPILSTVPGLGMRSPPQFPEKASYHLQVVSVAVLSAGVPNGLESNTGGGAPSHPAPP